MRRLLEGKEAGQFGGGEVGRARDLELYPHYGTWYGKTDVWVVMDVARTSAC